MKRDVLLVAPIYAPTREQLESDYTVHRLWEAKDRDAMLATLADRIEILVTSGGAGAARTLIERLPRLRLIACFGVGVDAIDLAAARERDIAVTNTPDVLTDDVADLAIGLMLAALRGIAAADRYVRAGRWKQGAMPLQSKVTGKRVGVVGMGRIGQAIARRAAAFDMTIAWNGPRAKEVRMALRAQPRCARRQCRRADRGLPWRSDDARADQPGRAAGPGSARRLR